MSCYEFVHLKYCTVYRIRMRMPQTFTLQSPVWYNSLQTWVHGTYVSRYTQRPCDATVDLHHEQRQDILEHLAHANSGCVNGLERIWTA